MKYVFGLDFFLTLDHVNQKALMLNLRQLISSTLLLLKNVSGPYPEKSLTTSVTPAFPQAL